MFLTNPAIRETAQLAEDTAANAKFKNDVICLRNSRTNAIKFTTHTPVPSAPSRLQSHAALVAPCNSI
jgi:hypothetical protein